MSFIFFGTHRCVPYGSSDQQAIKGKRTTHHRSDELYCNSMFQARLKINRKNILTQGGPPPYAYAQG